MGRCFSAERCEDRAVFGELVLPRARSTEPGAGRRDARRCAAGIWSCGRAVGEAEEKESALVKISELGAEIEKIREEVAISTEKWKKIQNEKDDLEQYLEKEVTKLHAQQKEELQMLEQRLLEDYSMKIKSLQEQQTLQLDLVKAQHLQQVSNITAAHKTSVQDLESKHRNSLIVLQDEHEQKIQELIAAHELEKMQLKESFEKMRLCLQDQIDTLMFQNQSLKDKANLFEETLNKNNEEQIKMAKAPYLHLEEDLKSLKHVLELKNHQIHEQDRRIMDLEKQVEKKLILEEKITVLQQQNEELRARIEQNTVKTRQLSEENANLQEHVEKEVKEKKRLSRTNEELLWKLMGGDATSPKKSPSAPSTPFYRCSSGSSSPAKVKTVRR